MYLFIKHLVSTLDGIGFSGKVPQLTSWTPTFSFCHHYLFPNPFLQ